MDKLVAYIMAKDTTMDKESPDNDFLDKGYMSDEDCIAHKDKFTDNIMEHSNMDHRIRRSRSRSQGYCRCRGPR